VRFIDKVLKEVKKNSTNNSLELDLFILHIDKFISKDRNVVVLALDDEYEKFLDKE
jgi:hypothetical protein